jgi:streptogramin lyase
MPNTCPHIAAGPDGTLWFTESLGNKIGRFTPPGGAVASATSTTSVPTEAVPTTPAPGSEPTAPATATPHTAPATPSVHEVAQATTISGGNTERIGQITPAGHLIEYTLPPNRLAGYITVGPDGNLWFADSQSNHIGRMTLAGEVTEYTVPTPNNYLGLIVTGPDGNVWFTEISQIGRITPRGDITEFPVAAPFGAPFGITSGPDGNIWFTHNDVRPKANEVGRITPAGEIMGGLGAQVGGITVGPNGNLWFPLVNLGSFGPSGNPGSIVCMSLSGDLLMTYPIIEGDGLMSMTPGPDGNLWFPCGAFQIGFMTPGGTLSQVSAPAPS